MTPALPLGKKTQATPPALSEAVLLADLCSAWFDPQERHMPLRWRPLIQWHNARRAAGLHPQGLIAMARSTTKVTALDTAGRPVSGINFASQDYLGLATSPALIAAAQASLARGMFHSSGTAPLMGMSTALVALETRMAQFLRLPEAVVFPSGAEANRAAIRTLLAPADHALIDAHAHPALFEAARAITPHVHRIPPGSVDAVERRLRRLRRSHPRAGILVATSAVAAFTSAIADIPALADLCREHGAVLLVDTAHDLGAMGPTGRGVMEMQGAMGRADIVTGSFAKVFGANGGFVAARETAMKPALRFSPGGQAQSAALSPLSAAMILAALDVIDSPDGAARRQRLMANVQRLRNHLMADGYAVMGRASPLVPVRLPGLADARRMTALVEGQGILLSLLESPVVAAHAPRWRLQMMCDHSPAEVDQFATLARALRPSGQIARRVPTGQPA